MVIDEVPKQRLNPTASGMQNMALSFFALCSTVGYPHPRRKRREFFVGIARCPT